MLLVWFVHHILSFSVSKRVYLHIEKFHEPLNLLHTGVSFSNKIKNVRYDFRPFGTTGTSYETNAEDRLDIERLFPVAVTDEYRDEFRRHREELETKTILWGETNKTWQEIADFELEHLCPKRYILGVHDCRHYARDFTRWSCNNATPVWSLRFLWERL